MINQVRNNAILIKFYIDLEKAKEENARYNTLFSDGNGSKEKFHVNKKEILKDLMLDKEVEKKLQKINQKKKKNNESL